MIIIDHMSNIWDMVFMSGIHKHEEWKNDDHRSCVEHQGHGICLEETNINEYYHRRRFEKQ